MQSFISKPRKRFTVLNVIYSLLFVHLTETVISSGQSVYLCCLSAMPSRTCLYFFLPSECCVNTK